VYGDFSATLYMDVLILGCFPLFRTRVYYSKYVLHMPTLCYLI
jgi:hypothetical protein